MTEIILIRLDTDRYGKDIIGLLERALESRGNHGFLYRETFWKVDIFTTKRMLQYPGFKEDYEKTFFAQLGYRVKKAKKTKEFLTQICVKADFVLEQLYPEFEMEIRIPDHQDTPIKSLKKYCLSEWPSGIVIPEIIHFFNLITDIKHRNNHNA